MFITQIAPKAFLNKLVDAHKAVPDVPTSELNPEDAADYNKIAKRLGIAVRPEAPGKPFRSWLSQQGIVCYNARTVRNYLDKELGLASRNKWCWRAVNRQSCEPSHMFFPQRFEGAIMAHRHTQLASIYAKPIPMPVLMTMDRVMEKFPDAKFYVSDGTTKEELKGIEREEAARRAVAKDPFLLCIVERECYIIERWDEPRFRG